MVSQYVHPSSLNYKNPNNGFSHRLVLFTFTISQLNLCMWNLILQALSEPYLFNVCSILMRWLPLYGKNTRRFSIQTESRLSTPCFPLSWQPLTPLSKKLPILLSFCGINCFFLMWKGQSVVGMSPSFGLNPLIRYICLWIGVANIGSLYLSTFEGAILLYLTRSLIVVPLGKFFHTCLLWRTCYLICSEPFLVPYQNSGYNVFHIF